jgi:hypothetical protein
MVVSLVLTYADHVQPDHTKELRDPSVMHTHDCVEIAVHLPAVFCEHSHELPSQLSARCISQPVSGIAIVDLSTASWVASVG